METGLVFDIQQNSVQDGPGIRTTVFLKGCPLCCQWCQSPEGQSARPEMMLFESRCVACGECRYACQFAESLEGDSPLPPQVEGCTACGECAEACPTDARQVVGRQMTVAAVMAAVTRGAVADGESAGGVTFSGGEPLTQPAFLKELLRACRARSLRTAVDTCGFACTNILLEAAQLTDLILFDLKLMDDAKHREYTGVSNAPILANLKALDQVHDNIWVRVPLIPGINDDDENLEAVARFASSIPGVTQVSVLPYHKLGVQRFRRLGRALPQEGLMPPSAAQVEQAVGRFHAFGLTAFAGA